MIRHIAALILVLALSATGAPRALAAATDVYDYIRDQKDLSRFADMISDAGLKDLFRGKDGVVTVFAPTNSAISDISSADMKRIKASRENLQNFVRYHIVTGSRMPSSTINGRKSSTAAANSESIMFDGTDPKGPAKVGAGHLVTGDAQVGSSIVHTISAALIPVGLKDPAESQKQEVKTEEQPKETLSAVGTAKGKAPIGTSVPVGSSIPVGTASGKAGVSVGTAHLPVSSSVPQPEPPAPPAEKPKSKGFNFFGIHLGG